MTESGIMAEETNREQRQAIDAAFAEMANDLEYQQKALQIVEEFRFSDWEALQLAESQFDEAEPSTWFEE